jgi:hypothetical protein
MHRSAIEYGAIIALNVVAVDINNFLQQFSSALERVMLSSRGGIKNLILVEIEWPIRFRPRRKGQERHNSGLYNVQCDNRAVLLTILNSSLLGSCRTEADIHAHM